eukprot:gnl/Dysnectes_brevis/3561_a4527_680.p1 GENE.gnl/Dysnectes_brevis/3561_a4527_680~~gnl/Dysnectes_brevis/3561_a4527_680.p1  ORF type:complete len:597 (+),score=146.67 gnl/Dysnectes_brevis/3561_a4527_680:75-1865(+)
MSQSDFSQPLLNEGRAALENIVSSIRSDNKVLIMDRCLRTPISLYCPKISQMVKNVLFLRRSIRASDVGKHPSLIYVIRPTIPSLNIIAEHIHSLSSSLGADFHIICTPDITESVQKHLEDLQILSRLLSLDAWPVHWTPLDTDLFSMGDASAFRRIAKGDPQPLLALAVALADLQRWVGGFGAGSITARGPSAVRVAKMLPRLVQDDLPPPKLRGVLILDRAIDPLSLVAMPWTYAAMLQETKGLRDGFLPKKGRLDDHDPVFLAMRSLHLSEVPETAQRLGKAVSEALREGQAFSDGVSGRSTGAAMRDARRVMERLSSLKPLEQRMPLHLELAGALQTGVGMDQAIRYNLLETMLRGRVSSSRWSDITKVMARSPIGDPFSALQLACAWSLTQGGIKPKQMRELKEVLVGVHGHHHEYTLDLLESVGWLRSTHRPWFPDVRKQYQLVVDPGQMKLQDPDDPSFVFNFMSPVAARLVEKDLVPSEDSGLRKLVGGLKRGVEDWPGAEEMTPDTDADYEGDSEGPLLVVFVGGVTPSEVAALRFLSAKHDMPVLIGATDVQSGIEIFRTMGQDLTTEGAALGNTGMEVEVKGRKR